MIEEHLVDQMVNTLFRSLMYVILSHLRINGTQPVRIFRAPTSICEPSQTANAICDGVAAEKPAGIGREMTTAQPFGVLTPFPFETAFGAGDSVLGPSAIRSSTG